VSHKAGVLAYYESRDLQPTTFISCADADALVQQLVAERITRRVIRLLSPASVFHAANATLFPQPHLETSEDTSAGDSRSREERQHWTAGGELRGVRVVLPDGAMNRWLAVCQRADVALAMDYQWG
jgi:hypothetical protein